MDEQLPLTVFERYMLADDTPAWPMSISLVADVLGLPSADIVAEALERTLARHPLLRSTVDIARPRRPRWRFRADLPVPVDEAGDHQPLTPPETEYIDPTRELPLRVQVRRGTESARLVLQLHHTAVDGMGTVIFLADLLACCRSLASGTGAETVHPRETSHLAFRDRFYQPGRALIGRLSQFPKAIRKGLRFRGIQPLPLGLPEEPDYVPLREPLANIHSRTLSAETTARLRSRARDCLATVNDLLLCELFQLVADRTSAGDDQWLRIGMPCNQRDERDARLPAANKVTISFLNRLQSECRDPGSLLESIRRETGEIKQTRRGLQMLEFLWLLDVCQPWRPLQIPGGPCGATTVLSNLGVIDELLGEAAGPLPTEDSQSERMTGPLLQGLSMVPGGRRGTAAVFFALTLRGRLTLTLWFDPRVFTEEAAAEMLDSYLERVQSAAGTEPASQAAAGDDRAAMSATSVRAR